MAHSKSTLEIKPIEEYFIRKRNKCLMVVNSFEGTTKPLVGYRKDEEVLRKTLERFEFDVHVLWNLNGKDILREVNKFIAKTDFSGSDSVAFAIFTHGGKHGELFGEDDVAVNIYKIVQCYTFEDKFNGLPKLFFIQACRGILQSQVEPKTVRAAGGEDEQAHEADIFLFYSSFEGHRSFVDDHNGSFFINTLCKVLNEYGGMYPLQEIATMVINALSKYERREGNELMSQVPVIESSLTQKVYLNASSLKPLMSNLKITAVMGKKEDFSPGADEREKERKEPNRTIQGQLENEQRADEKAKDEQKRKEKEYSERNIQEQLKKSQRLPEVVTAYDTASDKYEHVDGMLLRGKTDDVITLLAHRGEEVVALRDDDGSTLFMWAARWGRLEVVREMGRVATCDPLAVDGIGSTALYYAVVRDRTEVIRYIARTYPAMLSMRDEDGDTPFTRGINLNKTKSVDVLREIARERKINPNREWKRDKSKAYKRR